MRAKPGTDMRVAIGMLCGWLGGMKTRFLSLLVLGLNLAFPFVSTQAADDLLVKATFCHGLEENQSPKDKAEFFMPEQPIFLSIELKGRPKSGAVAAKFLFRDSLIADASVDVAKVNEGVIFSIGQNTFVGFDVTHQEPLPVGNCYTAEVTFDGKPLGTFPFRVAPPKGALPSKFISAKLAKATDEHHRPVDEAREFGGEEKVFLAGEADLGLSSWLEATWTVNGVIDEQGTRSLTMEESKAKVPFSFAFIPAGGWPAGTHEVSLSLDGEVVAKEKFTVKVGAPMAGATKLEIDSAQLFRDDGKGEPGEAVKAFGTGDTVLHVQWKLKQKALAKGIQFSWVLVEVEGEKPQTIATADVEPAVNDEISSSLTTKQGLPVGKYRVDLLQNGQVLDSKAFEVK